MARRRQPTREPIAQQIEDLEREWAKQKAIVEHWTRDGIAVSLERPGTQPVSAITVMSEIYQPRAGINEKHVSDLARAIRSIGALDPVTVMAVGDRTILIDGHHRLEAYGRAGWHQEVPVTYYEGSPSDAVLAATEANSMVKLQMDSSERQNRAWRLVLMDRYTKPAIAGAAGVSVRQVANMRAVMKQLGADAFDHNKSWFRARAAVRGHGQLDEAEAEEFVEAQAQRFADKLAKTFSTKLAKNPEVAARALNIYFGRRLSDVWAELRQFVDLGAIEEEDAALDADLSVTEQAASTKSRLATDTDQSNDF